MKILSLHIDNFGKLQNYDRDFTDGVNCIEAENGYGKTTLAAFIKAMLYGIPHSTKRDITENERKHYTPWQGGAFGGTLDIETEKGSFRISRTFGKKAADDTFSLISLETKRESNAYTEDIGEELFGLDAESYEKSVFIPQYDVKIEMTSGIGAKLTSLLEDSGDMSGLDSAIESLEEYSKRFKHYKGNGGLIHESNAKLTATLSDIEACRRAEADADEAREALARVKSESGKCADEINEINARLDAAKAVKIKLNEYETYNTYLSDVERAKRRYEACAQSLGGELPTDDEIKEMSRLVAKINDASVDSEELTPDTAALLRMSERFSKEPPTDDMLDELSSKNAELKKTEGELALSLPCVAPERPIYKNEKALKYACVAALILTLVGFGICFVSVAVGVVLAVIGIAGTSVSAYFSKKIKLCNSSLDKEYENALATFNANEKRRAMLKARAETLYRELFDSLSRYYPGCPGGIDAILGRIYPDAENYRALLASSRAREEKSNAKKKELRAYLAEADVIFGRYSADISDGYSEALRKISDTVRAAQSASEDIAERKAVAAKYAEEKGLGEAVPEMPDTSEDEARIREISKRANLLLTDSGVISRKIEEFTSRAEGITELIERADALREDITEYEESRNAAELAKEYLKRASDMLSSKYLRNMEESFKDNYSFVTGDEKAPDIDAGLGISFRDGGSGRDPKWYSEGIRGVMSVCLRLSLVCALFKKEKPFLILDDPFSELDPSNFENAAKLIRRLGENQQIVYFTCHTSRIV